MKTHLCLALAMCLIGTALSAQRVKRVKEASKNKDLRKTFHVLKKDYTTKHGTYEEIYAGTLITKGQYEMGERTGKWEFNSYRNPLHFSGFYKEGAKDGQWTYYRGDTLFSKAFYSAGEADSVFSYFSTGRPSLELRTDTAGNGNVNVYYANGVVKEHSPLIHDHINGTVTLRYDDGQLYRTVEFRDGQRWEVLETLNRRGEAMDGGTLAEGSGTYRAYTYSKTSASARPKRPNPPNLYSTYTYKD